MNIDTHQIMLPRPPKNGAPHGKYISAVEILAQRICLTCPLSACNEISIECPIGPRCISASHYYTTRNRRNYLMRRHGPSIIAHLSRSSDATAQELASALNIPREIAYITVTALLFGSKHTISMAGSRNGSAVYHLEQTS